MPKLAKKTKKIGPLSAGPPFFFSFFLANLGILGDFDPSSKPSVGGTQKTKPSLKTTRGMNKNETASKDLRAGRRGPPKRLTPERGLRRPATAADPGQPWHRSGRRESLPADWLCGFVFASPMGRVGARHTTVGISISDPGTPTDFLVRRAPRRQTQ